MSDSPLQATPSGRPPSAELERALVDLGTHLSYPRSPDVSPAIRAHLEQHPRRRRSLQRLFRRRAVLYPLLAAIAILASVLALSPDARSTVASWFHFQGVIIKPGTTAPGPLGHNLNLGTRVSLVEAQQRVSFHILIPHLPILGTLDEVYIGKPGSGDRVSLVYRERPGIPRASATGAALLISEIRAHFFVGKVIPPRTVLEPVTIHGDQGVWMASNPHYLYYIDPNGKVISDTIRLTGNVLIWEHNKVTLRIEGRISRTRALEIAQSMG